MSGDIAAAGHPEAGADAGSLGYRDVAHSSVRRMIARRLTEAKQTVPHFYVVARCEIDGLLDLRRRLNDDRSAAKVSVNDLVVRAVALALRQVPEANVSFDETALRYYDAVDVAVAVATPRGLITPILRHADTRDPRDLAVEMRELADRAKAGRLKPHEYMGGSASVSNLGMFGVEEFSAILNPPQSCIFAVGAGVEQPVVRNGALVAATVMTTTISFDHRAIDGDLAARLVAAYKTLLEDPDSLVTLRR
ncbi:MAG TPA: dihydrolipoamide acetyltransferase family protein [Sphingopyxis sp.]|uniref:dihydrolipoamide acetyltransferase family protein n=1 Tax=Sphingopyxis sp. TaxID=1908224 RepID=UPI002C54951E|nr:dihydrolipoamide acetyltransferase family protein [Sphingopyxis sp.]HWW58891.1 dihydrolipoamide acetyltransferase family protein [Sphingopyxis sp.]